MDVFDYSQFELEALEPWNEIYDFHSTLADNLKRLINEAILLPNADIQLPIGVAYILIPSALAKIVPILLTQGHKGTGKSTFGIAASIVHNSPIHSSSDTFASLRNDLDKMRWYDVQPACSIERNCCLIWDDIDANVLINKPDIYRMLKVGYDKSTDIIQIAGSQGENLQFRVFSPKIVSSIHPFFNDPMFPELQRRLIVLKTKKYENFTKWEKEKLNIDGDFNIAEKLDFRAYNWNGFQINFDNLWNDANRCRQYVNLRKRLVGKKKGFIVPQHIEGEQWTISIDLICSGVCSGVWDSLDEALDCVDKYWYWFKNSIAAENGAMMQALESFIEEEVGAIKRANEEFGEELVSPKIPAEKLKKRIDYHHSRGELDRLPRLNVIQDCMRQLGWKLDLGYWVQDL